MLKRYFVISSDFTKNTFTLVIGTAVAQSIPFLLHPFLRRIYSAEDFGAFSIYLSLLGILSIVSALRYEAAIVLPKENEESANIFALTFLINASFSLLVLAIIYLFHDSIIAFINFPQHYSGYLYLLPLATFIFSVYQSMNYWLIRQKAFRASTQNKIIRRGVEGGVQLGLGALRIPGGLFLGDVAGNIANVFAGLRQMFRNLFVLKTVSLSKIRSVAREYNHFPKFNVLPTLLSSIANVLPFLLINKFYSTETVGFLDLTKLVLSIPLVFISATISQVLFQQITTHKNNSISIWNDIKKVMIILLAFIAVEMLVILPFGPQLFGLVFGEKYVLSGLYSRILIFSFATNFISSTFSCVFISMNKLKVNAVWQILYFAGICSLIFFKDYSIDRFIRIFVAIDVTFQIINCLLIFTIVQQYEKNIQSHVSE